MTVRWLSRTNLGKRYDFCMVIVKFCLGCLVCPGGETARHFETVGQFRWAILLWLESGRSRWSGCGSLVSIRLRTIFLVGFQYHCFHWAELFVVCLVWVLPSVSLGRDGICLRWRAIGIVAWVLSRWLLSFLIRQGLWVCRGVAEIRKHCLRYPQRREILVQILLIRKIYLHLQSQGEFA